MLHVFRVDISNAYISVSIFARQESFSQVRSHFMTYLDKLNSQQCGANLLEHHSDIVDLFE